VILIFWLIVSSGSLLSCECYRASRERREADIHRLIVIPLSFLRRLDSLKYTSVIALFSIAYLVILVVAHFIKGDTIADRGAVRVFEWAGPVSALAAFPVIVFAYTCHQNVCQP
jgi:amino acid permease